MKKPLTLKKNMEFRRVYQRGKSTANRNLVLYYLPNNVPELRMGITVSKKVGKKCCPKPSEATHQGKFEGTGTITAPRL